MGAVAIFDAMLSLQPLLLYLARGSEGEHAHRFTATKFGFAPGLAQARLTRARSDLPAKKNHVTAARLVSSRSFLRAEAMRSTRALSEIIGASQTIFRARLRSRASSLLTPCLPRWRRGRQ